MCLRIIAVACARSCLHACVRVCFYMQGCRRACKRSVHTYMRVAGCNRANVHGVGSDASTRACGHELVGACMCSTVRACARRACMLACVSGLHSGPHCRRIHSAA